MGECNNVITSSILRVPKWFSLGSRRRQLYESLLPLSVMPRAEGLKCGSVCCIGGIPGRPRVGAQGLYFLVPWNCSVKAILEECTEGLLPYTGPHTLQLRGRNGLFSDVLHE